MRAMPEAIPLALTYWFYLLVAWGLAGLFVAFRILAGKSLPAGLSMRAGLLLWLGLPALLALRGWFVQWGAMPPHLLRVVVPMALFVIGFALSPAGKRAAERLTFTLLTGIQAFRMPLEMLLFALAGRAALPEEMTLAGYNYDIVTGALALVLWSFLYKKGVASWALWAFNILGLVLLATVISIAVLSFPEPFGWFSPPNVLVALYPWVWLPTFLVQLALVSHLLSIRKLLLERVALLSDIDTSEEGARGSSGVSPKY